MLRKAAAAVLRLLQSVRLAVVLILIVLILSLLSTFVPRGMQASYYRGRYSPAAADIILGLGFDRFFSSALFLVPAAAFAVNLLSCTVGRIVKRLRARPRRHGPDLIHIGLLALMAGGLLTSSLRSEQLLVLCEGEEEAISGYTVRLDSFEYTSYDNGTPRSWVSTVSVRGQDGAARPAASIRVNAPLRLPGVILYQASFAAEGTIRLKDPASGELFPVDTGRAFREGDVVWYAADVEKGAAGWAALFIKVLGDREAGRVKAAPGGRVGSFTVEDIEGRLESGLNAVRDPGYYAVLPAFALIMAGLVLTFIQKRRDAT